MFPIDFQLDCACGFSCAQLEVFSLAGYFQKPVALIDLHSDYKELIGGHKDNIRRAVSKAEKAGFTVRFFHMPSYRADIVEINTSKEIRSGGKMRDNYRRSVEELGGQPVVRQEPPPPACPRHCTVALGCFSQTGGHWRDGQLAAYLNINLYGNFVNYSSILGHGDYLNTGIMSLLHIRALEHLAANGFSRYVIYYLAQNPEGLAAWKRRHGFRPHTITCADCPNLLV
jgi:hypothetical protein